MSGRGVAAVTSGRGVAAMTAIVLLAAITAVGAAATQASATGSLALGSPRVVPLTPRVVPAPPRVLSLRPRVISVAPKRTRPNTFDVGSDVLFAFDSATLSSSARAVLGSIVAHLRRDRPGTVTVAGYTDSIGTRKFNLGLSRRRASSVRAYLARNVGNAHVGYRALGFGEADPVAPNKVDGHDNPAGRQKNRRVVVTYAPR